MIHHVFIENFKAIYRAADLTVQPFTVFIGNNGSGKSSIMEALRVLQLSVRADLDEAFKEWGGLDKIRNYNAHLTQEADTKKGFTKKFEPITIAVKATTNEKLFEYQVIINMSLNGNYFVVEHEELLCDSQPVFVSDVKGNQNDATAIFSKTISGEPLEWNYKADSLLLGFKGSPMISSELEEFADYVESWQFLFLNAQEMGNPVVQKRTYGDVKLDFNGRNIAEYILWIRSQGQDYLDNIIRKMQFVLPYITSLEPHILESVNREVELFLYEANEKSKPLPGWLFSSGTLRILALLSIFETPKIPSVVFIDEIENGLDPRTLGLLVSEIKNISEDKSMQIIAASHSPYFLDLISLESIVVCEKGNEGSAYHLPNDEEKLRIWKEKFSPGKLYTMGNLSK